MHLRECFGLARRGVLVQYRERCTVLRYQEVRCPILACAANRGERGCFCDYLVHGLVCDHPVYRRRWREATDYQEPEAVEVEQVQPAGPHSLTWRCDQVRRASKPMTPERARQLLLELGAMSDV